MVYARIQSSLSSIDADAKALSDQVAALTNQIALLDAALAQAKAEGNAQASEIVALKGEIVTLKARIAELEAGIPTPATVTVACSPATVAEDGTANLVYTFTRSGSTASSLAVSYTVGGTATIGTDYTGIATAGTTKTVTFAAGAATALVTVDPTTDTAVESGETVEVTLQAGTGYVMGAPSVATGTITNDDFGNNFGIPIGGWSDPSFVNMTERTSGGSAVNGQVLSNTSINILGQSGAFAAVVVDNTGTLRRLRVRANEGIRVTTGARLIEGCYVEVTATSTHSDSLQAYEPGATGTITLRNSWLRNIPGTHPSGNGAYWSANDWRGNHVLENVLLSCGAFTLRIPGDGGNSMSLTNVFFEEGTSTFGPLWFPEVNGRRPAIVKWENVRFARIVNGALVLGAAIPRPY